MNTIIPRESIPQYVLAQCPVGESVEIWCINGVYYIDGKIAKPQEGHQTWLRDSNVKSAGKIKDPEDD